MSELVVSRKTSDVTAPALVETKLTLPQSTIVCCPLSQLKDITLRHGWSKKWKYKIYLTVRFCHINVVFSIFETVILQKGILSASSVDKKWLSFSWKLTSFVRVWRAYWPVPFAKRERGCHASYGDRKRGRRRPFSAVTPLSHSFSPSANRADLTRFFSYNHSSFILFLLFFSQYTSSSHSIECLPLHGRLREAQEQKKETSLRRLFLILMQAAHHVIKEEEMLLQQQLCRTLLTYKLNLIAMSTSRFSGCFQRPLRS